MVDVRRWPAQERSDPRPAGDPARVTDVHCHVGLLGDAHPAWGRMSTWYRGQPVFRAMMLYGRMDAGEVSDAALRACAEETIRSSHLGHVVCLAIDPVYDLDGRRRQDLAHFWVDNDYILDLQRTLGEKVLLGASVHPYDLAFEERVLHYVDEGAVLLKWLPSAQQLDLAHPKVGAALRFLATARHGRPLPLLLHVGPEYAIPSSDPRTASYDYLSWDWRDGLRNRLQSPGRRVHRPDARAIHANLRAGLDAGAVIIFAHCGLPYYARTRLGRILEHGELRTIRRYLQDYPADAPGTRGRCYADVSAMVTPFRRSYFGALGRLPPGSLLFGSDFPTPVFELSAGLGEALSDLKAALQGELDRLLIPEDNLLDVNFRELQHYFPGHPMFTNFETLL